MTTERCTASRSSIAPGTPDYLALQKAMAAIGKLRRGAGPWAGLIQLGAQHKQASKKSK